MNISSHEEYGLRCLVRLARSAPSLPLPASKISEQEAISIEYVSKFMHLFRKAGLVRSLRGIQGGFILSRPPAEIPIAEVLEALKQKPKSSSLGFCSQFSGKSAVCANHDECSVRPLWWSVTRYFDALVSQLSLADFLQSEIEVQRKIHESFMAFLNTENLKQSPPHKKG